MSCIENLAYSIMSTILAAPPRIINREVFFHETLPIMFPGARYDYRKELEKVLKKQAKDHKGPPMRTIAET